MTRSDVSGLDKDSRTRLDRLFGVRFGSLNSIIEILREYEAETRKMIRDAIAAMLIELARTL